MTIQEEPNHQFNSVSDSTIEQAQANTLFAVQAQVAKVNAAKAADYEVQFASYSKQMDERPDATNIYPPSPAYAEVVRTAVGGWPVVDLSSGLVCRYKFWTPAKTTPVVSMFGNGVQPTDTFALFNRATVYGAPVEYAGMKFLRVA